MAVATVAGMAQVGISAASMGAIRSALSKAAFTMVAGSLIDTAVTAIVVVGTETGWALL
jgi:hypothetical protein